MYVFKFRAEVCFFKYNVKEFKNLFLNFLLKWKTKCNLDPYVDTTALGTEIPQGVDSVKLFS